MALEKGSWQRIVDRNYDLGVGVSEFETVIEVAAGGADQKPLVEALGLLAGLRAELDAAERALIEAARDRGVGWARIAAALGLGSRQAAEQRLLRLSAGATRDAVQARATRLSQRNIDKPYGDQIAQLRKAVGSVVRQISSQSTWDGSHPRAALARETLENAISAVPGAMFHLTRQGLDDLDAMSSVDWPASVTEAVANLRLTWELCAPKI